MAQIVKEISVDVAKRNLFQAIVAKQHDSNSRFLKVTLVNEGEPILVDTTSVVTINACRADGSAGAFAGVVNGDGTVTVPLTNWMLELDDTVKCDITVVDAESRKLTSTSFELEVETAAYGDSEIKDDENYDLLVTLLANVADVTGECQAATEAANSAAQFAEQAMNMAYAAAENANSVAAHLEEVTNSLPEKLPNPQALIATGTTMGTITYDGANVAVINIPKALPNPNALIVTGTPEGDIVYNGSEGKVINIPAAGESAKDVTEAYTVSGLSNETDYLLTLTEPGEYLIQRTAENYRFRCQVENVNGALYHWIRTYGDDSIYGELLYIDGALVSDKEIDYTGVLYDVDVIDGVRYPRLGTSPQTLTEEQRENARNNIGAIPTPASAAVGQTIVVKAVDESGKPTEWECVDPEAENWDYEKTITLTEDAASVTVNTFDDGTNLMLKKIQVIAVTKNATSSNLSFTLEYDGYRSSKFKTFSSGTYAYADRWIYGYLQAEINNEGVLVSETLFNSNVVRYAGYSSDMQNSVVKTILGVTNDAEPTEIFPTKISKIEGITVGTPEGALIAGSNIRIRGVRV